MLVKMRGMEGYELVLLSGGFIGCQMPPFPSLADAGRWSNKIGGICWPWSFKLIR
jgi:hypothetical protein